MSELPYIVGNWKMHGVRSTLSEARSINRAAARYPRVQVALAPPATLIHRMQDVVQQMGVGGQDCHSEETGAHTGDISATMLKDAGADFVIVGHSERRADHGETDAKVKAKAEAALDAGLTVIVCVGESKTQRDAGNAVKVVTAQVKKSVPASKDAAKRLSVAYEPVWAIGTGDVASVDDIAEMHAAIRAELVKIYGEEGESVRILYGGSVKPENAGEILAVKDVGGALVGGASLTAESFTAIFGAVTEEREE